MDGSVDSKQQDKKYIFVRLNLPKNPLCIETNLLLQEKQVIVVRKASLGHC